ncbi:host cell division inhibitor Icd-like protein [Photorhabdus antumapuensis]
MHFLIVIARIEREARRQLSQQCVLFFRARLPFGGAT